MIKKIKKIYIFGLLISFLFGFFFHQEKFFPYPQMYYFYNNFFTKIQSDQKKVKYREQNIEWPLVL